MTGDEEATGIGNSTAMATSGVGIAKIAYADEGVLDLSGDETELLENRRLIVELFADSRVRARFRRVPKVHASRISSYRRR